MQKVYLLLRNNQQAGPFTLAELLQFDLTPYDLIWMEGKSAGWYYPQEMEALRPHLAFLQKPASPLAGVFAQATIAKPEPATPQKIFVSMPSTAVAKEAPKQQAATPLSNVEPTVPAFVSSLSSGPAEIKTTYANPPEEAAPDYVKQAYEKRPAKKPLFSKSGVIVLCLLAVALFATWRLANKPATEEANAPLQRPVAGAQPVSAGPENGAAEKPAAPQKAALRLTKKEKAPKNLVAVKAVAPVVGPKPAKTGPAEAAVNQPVKEMEDGHPAPVVKEESKAAEAKDAPATAEAPKKKKLRDKILDIFRKKQPEEKPEEARPADTDNGARQSSRREAGSSLAQLVTVKFEIPNDWMMGIKGARAILTNKSSETVSKSVVEISYYNDDNDLLAKKTVVFTNVKSKSTQTVSVPEHATATRLEYSVLSATGAGDAVAKL